MQNRQLIDILCIKDISLIYCRILEENNSSKYLEVEVVYDDKKTMRMNYRDKYFATFFNQIVKTYHRQKDKNNIIFLGDYTEDIINSYKIENHQEEVTDYNFYPFNTSKFYIDLMSDYLKQALKEIIQFFYLDQEIIINDIKGYRNRYLVNYEVSGKSYTIPFACQLDNKYNILFKVSGIKNNAFLINGSLTIKDQYVHIKWNNKDESISGKIVSDIDNGFNETVMCANGNIIGIRQENNLIKANELEDINSYLNLLNLKTFKKIMKTNNTNYLMYETTKEDKIQTNYACHLTKKDNIISILYNETKGHVKYDSELFFPFSNNHIRINLVKIKDKYLVQKENLIDSNYQYAIVDKNDLKKISEDEVKVYQKGVRR